MKLYTTKKVWIISTYSRLVGMEVCACCRVVVVMNWACVHQIAPHLHTHIHTVHIRCLYMHTCIHIRCYSTHEHTYPFNPHLMLSLRCISKANGGVACTTSHQDPPSPTGWRSTHSLTHSLTGLLNHPITPLLTYSLTHSLTHLTQSFSQAHINTSTKLFQHAHIHT